MGRILGRKNSNTEAEASSKFWFYSALILCFGFGLLTALDLVNVLNKPGEYPFGTELGWRYRNLDNYVFISLVELGVIGLAITLAISLKVISRNMSSILLLSALAVALTIPVVLFLLVL